MITKKIQVSNGFPGFDDTSDATAVASEILSGETAYVKGSKVTGTMPNNGSVSKTLDTSTKSYTIPSGYHNGSGKVSIATETKSATPTKSAQTITPTSGKVLSSVNVAAIPSNYITTSDATATSDDIVSPETAYVNGEKIIGTNPYEKVSTDNEVASQADLIEQIEAALEGKAGGGNQNYTIGSYIPTDVTQPSEITHGLGRKPNYFLLCATNTAVEKTPVQTGVKVAFWHSFRSDVNFAMAQYAILDSDSYPNQLKEYTINDGAGMTDLVYAQYSTETFIIMNPYDSVSPLNIGVTYFWIAG